MRVRFGKQFGKDLDDYRLEAKNRNRLLTLIEKIRSTQSIS